MPTTKSPAAAGVNQFSLNDARIYISGSATENFSFMFNTDYNSTTNKIDVLDAVARFAASPKFNIWAGRFLPPSDRANLYGPYYSHHWAVYTDGIQNGHPFVFQGRDNGVVYWGDFNKIKISVGAFDGGSLPTGNTEVLGAARIQIDFWDAEGGYYLNGTYYGDKNLLALGVRDSGASRQHGDDRRFPAGEEAARRRCRLDRKRVCQLQRAGRVSGLRLRQEPRGVRCLEATSFRNGGHGQVRDPRQVRHSAQFTDGVRRASTRTPAK